MKTSRTTILRAAAGAAASLPGVALAGGSLASAATLKDTANLLAAQLCNVLQQMHLEVTSTNFLLHGREDGSFEFHLNGAREFHGSYAGPGFYDVSMMGAILVCWLERDDLVARSGCAFERYLMGQYLAGEITNFRHFSDPKIIRARPDLGVM